MVGFCPVVELNVIVPVPDTFVHVYHDIPATSHVTIIEVAIHVFVEISDPILRRGAVLSILYICEPVVMFPALSITHAYTYPVHSLLITGTVVLHQLHVPLNAASVLYTIPVVRTAKLSPDVAVHVAL